MTAQERLDVCQELLSKGTVAHNRASQLVTLETGAEKFVGKVPKAENDKLTEEYDEAVAEIKKCVDKL